MAPGEGLGESGAVGMPHYHHVQRRLPPELLFGPDVLTAGSPVKNLPLTHCVAELVTHPVREPETNGWVQGPV